MWRIVAHADPVEIFPRSSQRPFLGRIRKPEIQEVRYFIGYFGVVEALRSQNRWLSSFIAGIGWQTNRDFL
jgi:hypothetical protein